MILTISESVTWLPYIFPFLSVQTQNPFLPGSCIFLQATFSPETPWHQAHTPWVWAKSDPKTHIFFLTQVWLKPTWQRKVDMPGNFLHSSLRIANRCTHPQTWGFRERFVHPERSDLNEHLELDQPRRNFPWVSCQKSEKKWLSRLQLRVRGNQPSETLRPQTALETSSPNTMSFSFVSSTLRLRQGDPNCRHGATVKWADEWQLGRWRCPQGWVKPQGTNATFQHSKAKSQKRIFREKPGNMTGWWFGTFSIFPYIGNNHPNWLTHIFQRGGPTNHQPDDVITWSYM